MKDRYLLGTAFAFLLSVPLGLLELELAFSVVAWAAAAYLFFFIPFAANFGAAGFLVSKGYGRTGVGLAVSGALLSTGIILGILVLSFISRGNG